RTVPSPAVRHVHLLDDHPLVVILVKPPPSPPTLHSNDPPTTELYTLSLHDALPISQIVRGRSARAKVPPLPTGCAPERAGRRRTDRKSTRLNSSHVKTSYAVFCLKKKKALAPRLLRVKVSKIIASLRMCATTFEPTV